MVQGAGVRVGWSILTGGGRGGLVGEKEREREREREREKGREGERGKGERGKGEKEQEKKRARRREREEIGTGGSRGDLVGGFGRGGGGVLLGGRGLQACPWRL